MALRRTCLTHDIRISSDQVDVSHRRIRTREGDLDEGISSEACECHAFLDSNSKLEAHRNFDANVKMSSIAHGAPDHSALVP